MHITAIIFFLLFTAASAYFTQVAVKNGAKELNPLMRLLLRSPALFWVAQIVFMGVVVSIIPMLGPWFSFLAVSAKAINAYNDYLVYRR